MMCIYSRRDYAYVVMAIKGTGPSPYAENVRQNLFAFVKGNKTVIFIVVSLFCSMHLNELNTTQNMAEGR